LTTLSLVFLSPATVRSTPAADLRVPLRTGQSERKGLRLPPSVRTPWICQGPSIGKPRAASAASAEAASGPPSLRLARWDVPSSSPPFWADAQSSGSAFGLFHFGLLCATASVPYNRPGYDLTSTMANSSFSAPHPIPAVDEEGKEPAPFPTGGFYFRSGKARIRNGNIVWAKLSRGIDPSQLAVAFQQKTFRLLQDFEALAEGTDDNLCRFAERYGPLIGLKPMGGERESVEYWRRCISTVNAIHRISRAVNENKLLPVDDPDWAVLGVRYGTKEDWQQLPAKLRMEMQTSALTGALNWNFLFWQVQPLLTWRDGSGFQLQLGGPSLQSGIGVQLVSAICGKHPFYVCDNPSCGRWYTPSRKPRDFEKHFCRECRAGDKDKASKKLWRQRDTEEKRKKRAKRDAAERAKRRNGNE
jgi:hypothetical protein